MKNLLNTLICVSLLAAMSVSMLACGGDSQTTTTAAAGVTTTPATTTTVPKQTTTVPAQTTTVPETTNVPDKPKDEPSSYYEEDEIYVIDGVKLVASNGYCEFAEDGGLEAKYERVDLVAWDTNFTYGKITVTMSGKPESEDNDNGLFLNIASGSMKDRVLSESFNEGDQYDLKTSGGYYMFFIGDKTSGLRLAKANVPTLDKTWVECAIVDGTRHVKELGYQHGDKFTITIEVLPGGIFKGYYGDTLMWTYTDEAPLQGTGIGVRLEHVGVKLYSIKIEPAEG